MQRYTLVYLLDANRVCLGYKKTGFGNGNWNGFGGKVEEGEDVKDAAVRELREECGVDVSRSDLVHVAIADFYFADGYHAHVFVYAVSRWTGEPQETREMRPEWFTLETIPYKNMWESDRLWLPRLLSGEKLRVSVWFDEIGTTSERVEVASVDIF